MIAPGEYRARAVDAKLGRAGSGTPQIGVRFQLLDPPGGFLTWYGFLSPRAQEITFRGLEAAGFVGDNLADCTWITNAPECSIVVEHETYEEKTRPRIQFINASGGIAMKGALDEGESLAFAEDMRGALLAFRQDHPSPKRDAAAPREFERPPCDVLDEQEGSHSPPKEDIPF